MANGLQTSDGQEGKTKIKETEKSVKNTDSIVEQYKPFLGEDVAANSAYVRRKLLKDEDYLDLLTGRILQQARPEPNFYNDKPEKHAEDFLKIKNDIRSRLVKETYSGQTLKEAIVDRSLELQNKQFNRLPVSSYKNTISSNQKLFKDSGLFNEEGVIAVDDRVLQNKLEADQEFHKKVEGIKFDEFTGALSKSHNLGGVDEENIDDMAEAYSLYEQFGSEALTHYINYKQHFLTDKSLEEQPPKVKDAIQFMNSAKKDGKTPFQYMSQFFGGEDSEYGQFTIEPIDKSLELEDGVPVHRDGNAYTNHFYIKEDEQEGLNNFIDLVRSGENSNISKFTKLTYDFSESPEGQSLIESLGGLVQFGEDLERKTYFEMSNEEISEDIKDGVEGHAYRAFRQDVLREAEKGEKFTYSDLYRTIMLNGSPSEGEAGKQYILDYENLDYKTRIAVDALMYAPGHRKYFKEVGGEITFNPQVEEKFQESFLGKAVGGQGTFFGSGMEEVPVYDSAGKFKGIVEQPDDGRLGRLYDTIAGFTWGASKVVASTIDEIFNIDRARDKVVELLDKSGAEDTAMTLENYWEERDNLLEYDVAGSEIMDGSGERFFPKAGNFAGQAGAYIYESLVAGTGAVNAIKSGVKASKLANASTFLKAKNTNKFNEILHKAVSTKPRALKSATFTHKITGGAALMAGGAPENFGILQNGAFDLVGNMTGLDTDKAKQSYNTSNRLTQFGLDFVSMAALDTAFDGLIGVARLARGKGVAIDEATGDFVKGLKGKDREFATDLRRLTNYLTDNLAERPIGNISESMIKTGDGYLAKAQPESIESLADFTAGYVNDAGDFMGNLKQTIKESVEFYDNKFNLRPLSEEEIERRVGGLYNQTIDAVGANIAHTLSQGTKPNSHSLPLRMYDLLMEDAPVVTRKRYKASNGQSYDSMSFAEAQEITQGSSNYSIRQNPDKTYSVFEVDSGYWTVDLAKSIRKNFMTENKGAAFNQYLRRKGIDPLSTQPKVKEKISEEMLNFNEHYGKRVAINAEESGRVIDIDNNGLVVLKQDGTITNIKGEYGGEGVSAKKDMKTPVRDSNMESYLEKQFEGATSTRTTPRETTEEINERLGREQSESPEMYDYISGQFADDVSANKKRLDRTAQRVEEMDSVKPKFEIPDDKTHQTYGITSRFWDSVNKSAEYSSKTRGAVRSIAKLLGTDGAADFNKFIKNVDDISLYDPKQIEGSLGSNIGVKIRSGNRQETFITNRTTPKNIFPSVWRFDKNGKLVRNEYWSRVERNVTFNNDGSVKLYKRQDIDGETWFRPSEDGTGVAINIQKPTTNLKTTEREIFKENIDGFKKNVGGENYYKPISEADQVVDISNMKGQTRPTPIPEDFTQEIPKSVKKQALSDDLEGALRIQLMNGPVAGAIAGFLGSQIIDEDSNPYMWAGAMALLGTRTARQAYMPFIKGAAETTYNNLPFKNASRQLSKEAQLKAQKGLQRIGLSNGTQSAEEIGFRESFLDEVGSISTATKDIGRRVKETMVNNKFFESPFNFMTKLNIPEATWGRNHLLKIGETVDEIYNNSTKRFRNNVVMRKTRDYQKEGISYDEARRRALEDTRRYDEWYEHEGGIGDIDNALRAIGEDPENLSQSLTFGQRLKDRLGIPVEREMNKKRAFNEAYARIMHSGANFDGQINFDFIKNPSLQRTYKANPDLMEFDKALLRQDDFKDFINANRSSYHDTLNRYIQTIDEQIADAEVNLRREMDGGSVTQQEFDLIMGFAKADKSFSEYKRTISSKLRPLLDRMNNDGKFYGIIDAVNARRKLTDLDWEYLPQMVDRNKLLRVKKDFVEGKIEGHENIAGLSQGERDAKFNEYMSGIIYDINTDPKTKRRLLRYDKDGQKLQRHNFNSKESAIREARRIATSLSNNPQTEVQGFKALGELDKFVKETTETVKGKEKSVYYLETPEGYDASLFSKENRNAGSSLFTDFQNGVLIRQSNFLENPRIQNLPMEILETDPWQLNRKYAFDTGRRIHAREAGIYTKKELNDKLLNPIKKGLERNGLGDTDVQKHVGRVEGIWNTMYNVLGGSPEEIRSKMRLYNASDILAKTLFTRFGFGFGRYNLFEWGVIGPNISSYDAVAGTLKLYGKDTNAIANMEDFILSENILQKQIGAFKPEFEAVQFGEANARDLATGAQAIANRWANNVGNFSPGRMIARNFGADISGAGLARLMPIAGDSFIGSNLLSTSINARAALGEANKLAKLRKALVDGVDDIDDKWIRQQIEENRWTLSEVDRKLEDLGIDDTQKFMEGQPEFENSVNTLDTSPNAVDEMFDTHPQYYSDLSNIVRTATQTFHGTNKMFRPEAWATPYGRMSAMYLTYPFNVGMQVVKRRIVQPVQMWETKFGKDLNALNAMDIAISKRRGNYKKLADQYGLSKSAVDEFPDHVVGAVSKAMTSVGVSVAGFTSVGVIQDLVSYPFVDDKYAWYQTKKNMIMNPYAPESEQVRISDIFTNADELQTWTELLNYTIANTARTGLFGIAGNPVESALRGGGLVNRDGIMAMVPAASVVNDVAKGIFKTAITPQDIDIKDVGETIYEWTPVLGSGYFGDVKRSLFSESNKSKFSLQSEGQNISFESINFNDQF